MKSLSNRDDDEMALWEELNHQQKREIQNHKRSGGRVYDSKSTIQAAVQQTISAVSDAASAAKDGIIRVVASTSNNDQGLSSNNPHYPGSLAEYGLASTQIPSWSYDQQSLSPVPKYYDASSSAPLLSHMDGSSPENNHGDSTGYNKDNNFLFLEKFNLAPKNEGWGAVADFDQFFSSLYSYYYHRGLIPLASKGAVELLSLLFSLWLSVFLFAYLDWSALWKCTDESSCYQNFHSYIIHKPFNHMSTWNFIVIIYIMLFASYGIFSIQMFVKSIRSAIESRYIFEEKLGISPRKLEGGAVEWYEIIEKLSKLQANGEYRIAVSAESIDPLSVAQRIMRRENFMIALFNLGLVNCSISWPSNFPFRKRFQAPFYSKTLEWCIYICILNYMFNFRYRIRPSFYMNPVALRRRFIVCGIVHAIFMPFILFFMVVYYYFQYSYDLRSSRQYFGRREWSRMALWQFREFNELQHIFDRRLGPTYDAAEEYLQLFTQNSVVHSFGRALMFLSGSLGAVLLSFAAINDAILLHVKFGNWNLLWYVGILGAVYSFGKGLLPDSTVHPKYHHNLYADMDEALKKVTRNTHYIPNHWKDRGWDESVKASFSTLFQHKTHLFLNEIVSVILAPIILCHSLPNCAKDICLFVQQVKIEVPGMGDICGFSSFDLDRFKDENFEESGTVDQQSFQCPRSRLEKVSNSFVNFTSSYPSWQCPSNSRLLLNRIEYLRKEQLAATHAEQLHHLALIQRQLETLQRLENISNEVVETLP